MLSYFVSFLENLQNFPGVLERQRILHNDTAHLFAQKIVFLCPGNVGIFELLLKGTPMKGYDILLRSLTFCIRSD
jgi:hypothetical protein